MKIKPFFYQGLAAIGLMFCLGTQMALAFVTVTVQPTSQTNLVLSTAVFNAQVSATAGETITGYTWQMSTNGLSPFATVAGATTATCTLTNVQTTNDGYYFAKVTYDSGTNVGLVSVSASVRLVVHDQARITSQPQGGFVLLAGTNVSFSVTAQGEPPPSYQWRLNGASLVNSPPHVTGANGPNLTLSNLVLADSGSYTVVVTNLYASATSQVATLTVLSPPIITGPPQNARVVNGSNALFSVTASGSTPLGYRWRKDGVALSNGGQFGGATTNKLTISAITTNNEGAYTVVISNAVGVVTSSPVTLTVLFPAVITSATNAVGRQGAFFSFTNTATGTLPITFGAVGLPAGLSIEPDSGVISGIPDVMGIFNVTVYATNEAMTTTGQLRVTLTTGVPGITSPLTASGKQGQDFTYTITASNDPVSFNTSVLPTGMNLDPATGIISGAPLVSGVFPVSIEASNRYGGDSQVLTLTIASSVPFISSSLTVGGRQGRSFGYTFRTTDPAQLSVGALPAGLSFSPTNAIISGIPIVSGIFQIPLGATNQFGSDSQVLTMTLTSSIPAITSSRTAGGNENQGGFRYTIRASNTPTEFGASGLPLGLTVNTNTGVISGTPLFGGAFTVPIWAINAWGTGTTNLTLTITNAVIGSLGVSNVIATYSSPYLLDFSFSLVDNLDPLSLNPVVRSPSQLQVVCMENGVVVPSETAQVVAKGSQKQLKSVLVLDYSVSMFVVPDAIPSMQVAAEDFINIQPVTALFGICEFHADYVAPQMVTTGFTSIKPLLIQTINGIEDNYVQGNYAGSRCWDAIYLALQQFGTTNNVDEQRYIIAMTDGNDDSSLVNTNTNVVDTLVALAQTNQVQIYVVGFGDNINVTDLKSLTDQTGGQYYEAATTSDLPLQFAKIAKSLTAQYVVRWATLRRAPDPFLPSFTVTVDGFTDGWPGDTNALYDPTQYAGNVKTGGMRLVPDAEVGPQTIRLRATYVPRFVREIQLRYRPNYPCTATLASAGTNEILYGWSLTETNDPTGLRTLTLLSPDPTNLLSSILYGAFGDLVTFHFTYPEAVTTTQAFSIFSLDNSIYTNFQPSGTSFVLSNAPSFITLYINPPPHGTPIPWLRAYGFTSNYAAAEVSDPNHNGLQVWQEYIAGLNPTNVNSRFTVWTAFATGQTPQIIFNTVATRTYRVEAATTLAPGDWVLLRDNITGTGGNILFIDNRTLSTVNKVFYRVGVY